MAYKPAQARVLEVSRSDDTTTILVDIDEPRSRSIAPAGLYQAKPWKVVMELHKLVWSSGTKHRFQTYQHQGELPIMNQRYVFQSWWTRDQLELAQSSPIQWQKQPFQPRDAVAFHTPQGTMVRPKRPNEVVPKGGKLVESGWDHEHCALCWASLSCLEGGETEGYTTGKEWVCVSCFQKYIASGFGQKLG